ncbi:endolytic transglycosylase MltG [Anoxybacillus sp.]|uniref:endolytic transglycosylase MltG n=1 Tax=Anoxybacillus sp. TaxID=1872573 RepID=UPI00263563DE|nr:endolytic transglycosylase MltG [uncultured Anoxybacillus sp.]
MRKTTRAFAAGILFATTMLAIVYNMYVDDKHITKQQYEQLMAERNKLAAELEKRKTEKRNTTSSPKQTYIYTLTIEKGETSRDIAKRLEQARIIDNAQSFLTYLDTHQLTRAVRPGTYVITSDMSYEQIAHQITK